MTGCLDTLGLPAVAAKASINGAADATDREDAFSAETERWWSPYDTEERRRLVTEFRDE